MKTTTAARLGSGVALLTAVLLAQSVPALAQDNPAFRNRVNAGLTAFTRAVNRSDVKALTAMLPADFHYISYYNNRYDRVHLLAGIRERNAIFDTFNVTFKVNKADVSGDVGVANASLMTKATFRDSRGKRHALETNETVKISFAKNNAAWVLKMAEATNFRQKVDGKVTH